MGRKLKESKLCPNCKKENIWFTGDICNNCYRKIKWKRKKQICNRCKRLMFLKGKGLCGGCYNIIYRLDYQKARNQMKRHNISYDSYKKITSNCIICGFDKVIDLHHLDGNKNNNSEKNMIGLCPNHHKMIHNIKFKEEINNLLKEKGFCPKEKLLKTNIKGSY